MFVTSYGTYEGNSWEDICQICFKQKYGDDYQEVKASPGDHGIEGFTNSGKVFQCYCPNENYNPDKLYNEQRDKITKDLKKLELFEKQLKKLLGDVKIKEWIFVTPRIDKNDLVKHCTAKTTEYRKKKLAILALDFKVLVQDTQFLLPHLQIALKEVFPKLLFEPIQGNSINDRINYKNTQSSLVENSNRKHKKRFPERTTNVEQKVDNFTDRTVKHFLDGKEILEKWGDVFSHNLERFYKLISQIEEEVEDECSFPTSDNNKRYESVKSKVFEKLNSNFEELDEITINHLTNYVIADWILRCPLNFE